MAGTLVIDTLKSSTTGPTVFQNTSGTEIGTLCRAWVNFNGTTSPGTIRASFNVTSVTKNATGNYTLNFTNALPDANYAMGFMATDGTGGASSADAKQCEYRSATTTTFNFVYARQYSPYSLADCTTGCIAIFR